MTTTTSDTPPEATPPTGEGGTGDPEPTSLPGRIRARISGGELGAWPVIIGLIIIWIVFQSLNSSFLTAQNLTFLCLQIAATGAISVGLVLVLLLGDIDLSVGSVAGVGAAVVAILIYNHGWPEILAILAAIATGLLIGTSQGFVRAKIGVPAFVVTLAGNLGFLGLQLYLLGDQGTVYIPDNGIVAALTHNFLSDIAGWILAVVVVGIYAAAALVGYRRRIAAELPTRGMGSVIVRIVGLAVIAFATVGVLDNDRGVPLALLIFVGMVVIVDLVLRRTRYGRTIFAVGGNIEAARRAGINVAFVQITVFALCSMFAVFGGILLTSRSYSASQSTGGSDTLLLAIAATVIGGVSLFGGRGSAYGALLGGLVLGSITSGMLLLSLSSSVRYMITAAVLLVAVVLDSLARRGRRAHGRE